MTTKSEIEEMKKNINNNTTAITNIETTAEIKDKTFDDSIVRIESKLDKYIYYLVTVGVGIAISIVITR
jgi:hypothetical protein